MKKAMCIPAFILALIMIFGTAACSGKSDTEKVVTMPSDTTVTAESEDLTYKDELPEEDFEGYEFRVVTGIHGTYLISAFSADSESGDTLNDVLYRRNIKLEERFNFKFKENVMKDIFNVNDEIKKTTTAGDDAYDLAMMIDRYALTAGIEGQLYSYNDLPYINLDKGYWDQNMSRDFSIGNKLFFTSGADNLVFFSSITHLVFNKVMASDYNLENPYDLIHNGKWTFETFFGMMSDVTADLDGDGKYTDTDQYGIVATNNMFWPTLWINSGYKLVEKDEFDMPYFNIPGNDGFASILQSIHDYGYGGDSKSVFLIGRDKVTSYTTAGSSYNLAMVMFTAGRSLFCGASLVTILDTRGMDNDFGIIPYPSQNEVDAGTAYGCRTFGGFPYVVPVTNSDLTRTSIIMEALACESYQSVRPALYDILLKTKVSRDTESEEMLDMMLSHRITDLGESYWWDNIESKFEKMYETGNLSLASSIEKLTPKAQESIDTAIEFFGKLG
jgi:hypothetical protein